MERPLSKLPSIGTAAKPNLHKTGQAQWPTDGLAGGDIPMPAHPVILNLSPKKARFLKRDSKGILLVYILR